MKHLLDLLNYEYPLIIAETALRTYLSRGKGKQWFAGHLLVNHNHLSSITCVRCFQPHEVLVDELMPERFYYICNHGYGGLEFVKEEEIRCWRFDLDSFLHLVVRQLDIKGGMQILVPKVLWKLGTNTILGTDAPVVCLFCRTLLPRVLQHLLGDTTTEHIVVLYVGESRPPQKTDANVVWLGLSQFLAVGTTYLQLDLASFIHRLTHAFQRVFFDVRNGDLIIDGQPTSHAHPSSPQYFFLRCLWEQFDVPVSHEDIFVYCCRELAKRAGISDWASEYLPGSFCHTMKRLLKQHSSHKNLCDEVIQSTRTHDEQNAYRLTVPRQPRSSPLGDAVVWDSQKFQ